VDGESCHVSWRNILPQGSPHGIQGNKRPLGILERLETSIVDQVTTAEEPNS
jgi:hypothetical protein